MLAFLPTAAYFETRLDTHIVSIQELPFTHGQSPWNSALRVIRSMVDKTQVGLVSIPQAIAQAALLFIGTAVKSLWIWLEIEIKVFNNGSSCLKKREKLEEKRLVC